MSRIAAIVVVPAALLVAVGAATVAAAADAPSMPSMLALQEAGAGDGFGWGSPRVAAAHESGR